MTKHITAALTLGLMLIGSTAWAQTTPRQAQPKVGPAQRLQIQKRIRDGVRTGQLAKPEMRQLHQRLIEARKHGQAIRKGGVTPAERLKLRREWRQLSRRLFQLKHNARRGGR